MSFTEIAAVLNTTEKNVPTRIVKMKLGVVCSRCLGTGQYSFNQISGSTCFKCNGAGNTLPKTKKEIANTLEEAKIAAADGTLDKYVAIQKAIDATKRGTDRLMAAWKEMDVLNRYSAYNIGSGEALDPEVRRRNSIAYDAYQAFTKETQQATSKIDWVKAQKILEDGLAAIAAVKAELTK